MVRPSGRTRLEAGGRRVPRPALQVETPSVVEPHVPIPSAVENGEVALRRVHQGRVASRRRRRVGRRAVRPAPAVKVQQLRMIERRVAVRRPAAKDKQ
eukprot:5432652-Prymnesium_polylepis.1